MSALSARRKKLLGVAAAVLAAAVALLVWLTRGPDIETPEEGGYELPVTFAEGEIPPSPHDPRTRPDDPTFVPDGGPRRPQSLTEEEKERVTVETEEPFDLEELPPTIVDPGPGEYLRFYGGRSGALSPHARPSWANVTTQMRSRHPDPPSVVAWTPTIRVQSGQAVPFLALLRTPEGRHRAQRVTLTLWDEAEAGERQVAEMTYVPGDEESPHDYEALYTADADQWPEPGNGRPVELNWLIRAEGTYEGEPYARDAGGVLTIHSPAGMLRAETIEVAKTNEGFVLRAQAVIEEQGTYWAYAEAWGGHDGDRPIAFGRLRRENLEPGTHTFELLFGGAIVADRGIDGPYAIRNLRFMRVDTVPPQEQEPIDPAATTPPWTAASFH